ncbi:MAG: helix-turn-helix domain-containing protein [Acidimicrobiia bacterium]
MSIRGEAQEAPRKRLGMGQAKPLLLDAAREVFALRGFRGARTREIADRAGVSEALLYRHFGSKARLFEEAILEPVNSFVATFVERWRADYNPDRAFEQTVGEFMEGMYDLMHEHRASVLALLASHAFENDDDGTAPPQPLFGNFVKDLEEIARVEVTTRHFEQADPVAYVRIAVSTAVAMGLLDEFLFGSSEEAGLTRERIVTEMTEMIATGIALRGKTKRQWRPSPKPSVPPTPNGDVSPRR